MATENYKLSYAVDSVKKGLYNVYVARGANSYAAMDWNDAVISYSKALAVNKTDATVLFNLGKSYIRSGSKEQGLNCLRQSLQLQNSEDVSRTLEAANRTTEQIVSLLARFTEDRYLTIELTHRLLEQNRNDDALARISNLARINPANVEISLLHAAALQKQGSDDNKAKSLAILRGLSKTDTSDLRGAVQTQYYTTCIQQANQLRDNTKSWIPYIFGSKTNDAAKAVLLYEEARMLFPNKYGSYLNNYIEMLATSQDERKAGDLYDQLREMFPTEDIHIDTTLLNRLSTVQNTEDSLAFTIRLHQSDPTSENLDKLCIAYIAHAKTLMARGEDDKALEQLMRAIQLKPNDSKLLAKLRKFHRSRANMFLAKNQPRAALTEMNHTMLAWMHASIEDHRFMAKLSAILKMPTEELTPHAYSS